MKRRSGKTWATVENDYFIPGKFREVIVCGDKLSAVCDYNVAQYKIKTYENKHVRDGNDFKATEGVVTQIETPPEEPLLAELRAFVDSVQTRKSAARRRLGRLRCRPRDERRAGIRENRQGSEAEIDTDHGLTRIEN